MPSILLWLSFLSPLVRGAVFNIPATTGPFAVGTTILEVIDHSRRDPLAPTPQPRDLSVSLFYPTSVRSHNATSYPNGRECQPALQLSSAVAAAYESSFGIPNGTLHNIITQACLGAPLSHPHQPLLFFTPGLGSSRELYSDTLIEIASYGWNVVSIDHPYETNVVQYPDGRAVYGLPMNGSEPQTIENIEIRAADLISVLNALSNSTITKKIPGYPGHGEFGFNLRKVGVFGHSLGGATALRAMINDTRFAVGTNLDGSFWGPEQYIGTDAPFMVLTAQSHNRRNDTSWAITWPNLRGFKREYTISGAEHNTFTDATLLKQIWGPSFPSDVVPLLGSINGTRIVGIERAYLTSLFGRFLKGENDGLLDGVGSHKWPEVTVGV
ncbi:Alpha/Beta hydrolase protein [Hypomontagnella submonticulosa]|nr:Alpha/Beta hydrolase protein [Hypomontagnella submonticulosa]